MQGRPRLEGESETKKVLCAMPPGLLEQIDTVAHLEFRTRSDLIREALRRYIDDFKKNGPRHRPPIMSIVTDEQETTVHLPSKY